MSRPDGHGLRRVDPHGSDRDEDAEEPPLPFVDRWVMPYIEDSALWPVTLVVIAHVVAFLAPALLFAFRERNAFAVLGLIGMAYLTLAGVRFELRRRRRPGAISAMLLATWALAGVLAWYGGRAGLI